MRTFGTLLLALIATGCSSVGNRALRELPIDGVTVGGLRSLAPDAPWALVEERRTVHSLPSGDSFERVGDGGWAVAAWSTGPQDGPGAGPVHAAERQVQERQSAQPGVSLDASGSDQPHVRDAQRHRIEQQGRPLVTKPLVPGRLDVGLPLLVDLGVGEAPFDDGPTPLHAGDPGPLGFSDTVLSLTVRRRLTGILRVHGTATLLREQDLTILEGLSDARFGFAVVGISASF